MHIEFVEIRNFRKLKSIRIDLASKTTLLVGANNSGKTSAMVALGHFLVDSRRFTTNDFTLSNWRAINEIGRKWEKNSGASTQEPALLSDWEPLLPSLDVWLHVGDKEVHHVKHLLPTLDWDGGLLGVRLRLEPKSLEDLQKEYVSAVAAANAVKNAAEGLKNVASSSTEKRDYSIALWPRSLSDFLERRLRRIFMLRAYALDPAQCEPPTNGVANIQLLHPESRALEIEPFSALVRIDEISAQRGFSDVAAKRDDDAGYGVREKQERKKLTDQLRAYYVKHLDPSEFPEAADLDALQAIETAQDLFDDRLKIGFKAALEEVQGLGYPGVTDPKLTISTRLRPTDGLNHEAAVQYDVISKVAEVVATTLRLPEEYNGLGYQNLISMVFRLMSFRDGWMEVGKARTKALAESSETNRISIPPLHLVLVEEPEAHLHAQVQQVFIRKAYEILRKHDDLGEKPDFKTQLIVSTHSSHVAHESDFESLRYFRRMPAAGPGEVPTTTVVNLSEVFGKLDDTKRFVTRYLRATHCDLFFADAAILLEGPAERMLVPHFVRKEFRSLDQSYISYLEIGGSHAHRLRPLIDHLGLTTLIITDLDAARETGKGAQQPARNSNQVSRNTTLKTWLPEATAIDVLLDMPSENKAKVYDVLHAVRVAYQQPVKIRFQDQGELEEAISGTFEDALVFENLEAFRKLDEDGPIRKVREAIEASKTAAELGTAMFELLKDISKARLALDLLLLKDPTQLQIPTYIRDGLSWLQARLQRNQNEVSEPETAVETKAAA
jgi:predicted ATP-dependent endonuclease of OLD family